MKIFFKKSYRFAICFTVLLTLLTAFVMLDTFVIPKTYQTVVTKAATESDSQTSASDTTQTENSSAVQSETTTAGVSDTSTLASTTSDTTAAGSETADTSQDTSDTGTSDTEPVITDTTYEDANIKISIETLREYDSNVYVADIYLTDASYLKTALANDTYGRNIKATTSEIASSNNAILAINGDYYGFRNYGYVLRNGTLYRDTAGDGDALVIDNNGDFSIASESDISSLNLSSIWQILSFGPALIDNGEIVVDSNDEVSQAKSSNPRTAIGQISALHYIIVVSDGRTNESAGLSLLNLAQVFADYGCTTAYNLDGGGSSTMVFNGEVVNIPTDGRSFGEREVSDIVYIGY